jgi:hypothetical protein
MASYPIPPWLAPVSPVEPFLQGTSIGARIASENAQRVLQQQQMQAQAQRAAEAAMESNRDYELRKASSEAEMSLRQRTADMGFQEQARKAQAQMDIQEKIKALGPDATNDQIAGIYARNWAQTGEGLSGLGTFMHYASPSSRTPTIQDFGGEKFVVSPQGTVHPINPKQPKLTAEQQSTLKELESDYRSLQQELRQLNVLEANQMIQNPKLKPMDKTPTIRRLNKARQDLDKYRQSLLKDAVSEDQGETKAASDDGLSMSDFQSWLKQSE